MPVRWWEDDRERKTNWSSCIIKQVTTVGHWSLIPLGTSGGHGRTHDLEVNPHLAPNGWGSQGMCTVLINYDFMATLGHWFPPTSGVPEHCRQKLSGYVLTFGSWARRPWNSKDQRDMGGTQIASAICKRKTGTQFIKWVHICNALRILYGVQPVWVSVADCIFYTDTAIFWSHMFLKNLAILC